MKREIKKLEKQLFGFSDPRSHLAEIKKLKAQLAPIEKHFDLMESGRLRALAERLGIEIPEKENWWYSNDHFDFPMQSLNRKGQAATKKLIRDEILRIATAIVVLLIPVLSLIVAILALRLKS
jgi:hypothetical protein